MPIHARAHPDGTLLPMRWAPAQIAAAAVGAVFVLVGALGFIPGATSHFDRLTVAGHYSGAMLLGLFNVSVLHNLVHLAFGAAGLAAARHFRGARTYLIAAGIIYLALSIYGSVIDRGSTMNFVPINNADNWLHLGLGMGMIGLGVALFGRRSDTVAVGQVSPADIAPAEENQ